jgi:chorismate mutase
MGAEVAIDDELDRVRAELDVLDRQLVALLARRFQVGARAAKIKRATGVSVHDAAREEKVIEQARAWAGEAGLPEDKVEDLFRRIVDLSRNSQIAAESSSA